MSDREYIGLVETAKLIRAELKKNFPGTKFAVRSESFAGGTSVNIRWTDGPTTKDVDAVVQVYSNSGFDGMIDMAYSKTAYRLPDGSVTYGESEGTEGSRGVVPSYKNTLPEGAKPVRFGASYVCTSRENSPEAMREAVKAVVEKFGNQIGLPDDLDSVVMSNPRWPDSYFIDPAFRDKDVTGEKGWNASWDFGSQVGQYMYNTARG